MTIKGKGASNGIAIGKAYELKEEKIVVSSQPIKPAEVKASIAKVKAAITVAINEIETIKKIASKTLKAEEVAIFDAHIQVVSDPELASQIEALIKNDLQNPLKAAETVIHNFASMFEAMDDEYMRERAADVKDVGRRLMFAIAGKKMPNLTTINEEVIIVAYDLTPSDTAQLNRKFVKGFVTTIGGRTSHAAIMARSLEIPAVLGTGEASAKINQGDKIILDGSTGVIIINPSAAELKTYETKGKAEAKAKAENQKYFGKKSITKDKKTVELAANIGTPEDMPGVIANDGEAIGLFRSEFLYMDAKNWPTEDEQYQSYAKVLKGMGDKLVVIRTLDIGGDKKLEYFKFPEEMNPFLGYRALRLSLDKKDIFQTQLRALLRASVHGKLGIMFPMVATIDEFLAAKAEFEKAKAALKKAKVKFSNEIQLGIMVEIPAAAILAEKFAAHVDFLSIGTNDLMQYTFAADRMSEKVAYLYQPLNPSILRMIALTIKGGHAHKKWVGMCGEMAGDPMVVPILVGLGLDEFSMTASSILGIRKQIANIDTKAAAILATKALEASTEAEVIKLVEAFNAKGSKA